MRDTASHLACSSSSSSSSAAFICLHYTELDWSGAGSRQQGLVTLRDVWTLIMIWAPCRRVVSRDVCCCIHDHRSLQRGAAQATLPRYCSRAQPVRWNIIVELLRIEHRNRYPISASNFQSFFQLTSIRYRAGKRKGRNCKSRPRQYDESRRRVGRFRKTS